MNKTDFDNKITSFNNWISSTKTKHLEVQKKPKKLNTLKTKDYNSFWDSIYFSSNDGSQKTCTRIQKRQRHW